jgi:hypothetical protein
MTAAHRRKSLRLEHRSEPLLSDRLFFARLLRVGAAAACLILFGLLVGAVGYRTTEGWSWLDAALNAAMILTGMGPVDKLHTQAGKVFAIAYALFSGVVFFSAIGLVFAPVAHRLLHAFHLEDEAARNE